MDIEDKFTQLKAENNFRTLPSAVNSGRFMRDGNHTMLNLASNDYLGIANNHKLANQFMEKIPPNGAKMSAASSRLMTGNFPIHRNLEDLLAELYGAESALVFNSGYHANTGILPAISDSGTLILADKLVHASIIDGIRLSDAKFIRYHHNNYEQLEHLLQEYHSKYEKIIIVSESLFSMDGDKADLPLLVKIKNSYQNVLLYLDEAHSFGVFGEKGLGLAEEVNCISEVDFLVGTFGKAAGSMGAFVICKQIVKDYLINRMRTFIFSTALPPICMEWTYFIINQFPKFQYEREYLKKISTALIEVLKACGYNCPSSSQIVPILIGDSSETIQKSEKLRENGFYALPVRPPTVPPGTSRIRISLTADIRTEEINDLIEKIKAL